MVVVETTAKEEEAPSDLAGMISKCDDTRNEIFVLIGPTITVVDDDDGGIQRRINHHEMNSE